MSTRTIQDLANEVLLVQNACNLCGVAQSFARAMIDLGEHCHTGTTERNTHPITILWLDKMTSLAGIQNLNSTEVDQAFTKVWDMAKGDNNNT